LIQKLLTFLLIVSFALFFQNCARLQSTPTLAEDSSQTTKTENGGPYGGKPGVFRYFSDSDPCTTLDLKGKPLPNEMILLKNTSPSRRDAFLTRQTCQDIKPILIPANEIQMDASADSLIYKNQSFLSQNRPGDFDIIAASCPAGKTAIPAAIRRNSFAFSVDWTSLQVWQSNVWSAGWYNFPGTAVGLDSTLSSLPAFLIERNDTTLLDNWRRASQHIYLPANTEYSFTFLARSGSVAAADFTFYRGVTGIPGDPKNEEAVITFDFQTRTTSLVRNTNVSIQSSSISPLGNGFVCTVNFTTSATGDQGESNIGVAPSARGQYYGNLGDSVVATAAQLVRINDFCR
jgi:hypothetical protein